MNTFQTIIYKEHAINSCYYCGKQEVKVLFALTPGSRYAYSISKVFLQQNKL